MAGNAFEGTGIGKDFSVTSGGKLNGPLGYLGQNPGKAYHGSARGKKLFTATVTSPDFTELMAKIGGMTGVDLSNEPIEIIIYNDAKREPTPGEEKRGDGPTYYAKFIEYGFTWWGHFNQHTGDWIPGNGEWKEGLRLFAKVRKRIKRELIKNYKRMALGGKMGFFNRETVHDALARTAETTIDWLTELTPEDTGQMKESWNWTERGGEYD